MGTGVYSDLFCRIYDTLGWNYYPRELAGQLVLWLKQNHPGAVSCLDLGCGTGVLCQELAARGFRTSGVDLSPGMIAIAKEHAPELEFHVGDMTDWQPPEPVDLATCTGDALNHLPGEEDVRRMLRSVFAALRPGGVFLFDMLSHREIPSEEPFVLEYDDRLLARFQVTREGELLCMRVRVEEDGEPRLTEEIRERIYPPEQVLSWLEETGFTVLQCADRLLMDSGVHGNTWFIAALKPLV